MQNDAMNLQEQQRRIDATIACASAKHMSDAKWRKLFHALEEFELGSIRWKFIGDERVFVARVPRGAAILERTLGDVLPYPYGAYREIEWIEIPDDQSAGLVERLAAIAEFPIQRLESSLRVNGYTW